MSAPVAVRPSRSTDWMERAACRGSDADFYSEKAESLTDAKAVCRQCPVRDACLHHALSHRETQGVWGGLDPDERTALIAKGMAPQVSAHVKNPVTVDCRTCGTPFQAMSRRSWYCAGCRVDARRESVSRYDNAKRVRS